MSLTVAIEIPQEVLHASRMTPEEMKRELAISKRAWSGMLAPHFFYKTHNFVNIFRRFFGIRLLGTAASQDRI